MKKIFDSVPLQAPKRNPFDLSYNMKLTGNMGKLIPILRQEVLPTDSFRVNTSHLIRFSPLIAPIMAQIDVYVHYFFVPYRLIWDDFEDYITGGEKGDLNPTHPTMKMGAGAGANFSEGSLNDYFGLPLVNTATPISNEPQISILPHRAYLEIYNEYYRQEWVHDPINYDKGSGNFDAASDVLSTVRSKSWEKDYFTSALPSTQKGSEAVVPLGSISPRYKPNTLSWEQYDNDLGEGYQLTEGPIKTVGTNANGPGSLVTQGPSGDAGLVIDNLEDTLPVDPISIIDLRKASSLQRWLELNAVAGSRYTEWLKAHYGSISADARLQRPEYLGGYKAPITISEILNTAADQAGDTLQAIGEQAGHAVSATGKKGFKKMFTEHGIILGLMSIIPKTEYNQGIPRLFTKRDRYDYHQPLLENIGEQEILNQELYYTQDDTGLVNSKEWGYQQRYIEYKQNQDFSCGEFRTDLDYWTMTRQFDELPTLSPSFIISDPTDRIFAVSAKTAHNLRIQIHNDIKALRPISYNKLPRLM